MGDLDGFQTVPFTIK